jgi:hypothetical protein
VLIKRCGGDAIKAMIGKPMCLTETRVPAVGNVIDKRDYLHKYFLLLNTNSIFDLRRS